MRQLEEKLNKTTRMEMEPELKEFKRVNHNVVELDDYEAGGTRGGSGKRLNKMINMANCNWSHCWGDGGVSLVQ